MVFLKGTIYMTLWYLLILYAIFCFWLQVFQGNNDPDTIVTNMLKMAVNAHYVRIKPQSWHNHIALRAEVYKGEASK